LKPAGVGEDVLTQKAEVSHRLHWQYLKMGMKKKVFAKGPF
jgi:hypothetical protein